MQEFRKFICGVFVGGAVFGSLAFLHAEPPAPVRDEPATRLDNGHYQLCVIPGVFNTLLDTRSGATWISQTGSTKWTPDKEAISK